MWERKRWLEGEKKKQRMCQRYHQSNKGKTTYIALFRLNKSSNMMKDFLSLINSVLSKQKYPIESLHINVYVHIRVWTLSDMLVFTLINQFTTCIYKLLTYPPKTKWVHCIVVQCCQNILNTSRLWRASELHVHMKFFSVQWLLWKCVLLIISNVRIKE